MSNMKKPKRNLQFKGQSASANILPGSGNKNQTLMDLMNECEGFLDGMENESRAKQNMQEEDSDEDSDGVLQFENEKH